MILTFTSSLILDYVREVRDVEKQYCGFQRNKMVDYRFAIVFSTTPLVGSVFDGRNRAISNLLFESRCVKKLGEQLVWEEIAGIRSCLEIYFNVPLEFEMWQLE